MLRINTSVLGLFLSIAVCLRTAQALFHGPAPMVGATGDKCPYNANLLPRHEEYRRHCEQEAGAGGADPNWICTVFWSQSLKGLSNATIIGDSRKYKQPDDLFLIKDGYMTDYTTRDPKQSYRLEWEHSVSLTYTYVKDGCYTITLEHWAEDDYRIWVSDNDNKERNVDTEHHRKPDPVTLCSKWFHVHIKNDA